MTTDPVLDARLKAFLDEHEAETAKGITQEALHGTLQTVSTEVAATRFRLDRYGRRLRAIEKKLDTGEEDLAVDTGVHQVEDVQRALELARITADLEAAKQKIASEDTRRADSMMFWKRRRLEWAERSVVFLLSGAVGALAHWIVTHGR